MDNQIKSKRRVTDHGEVFTAEREVNAMLDLVEEETQRVDSRFLEPACGDGNFLAEILRRKLEAAKRLSTFGRRKTPEASDYEKNAFLAITSIYGIDILKDNVLACRNRLYKIWDKEYKKICKKWVNDQTRAAVRFVLDRNIVCGNALTLRCVDEQGRDTDEPIVFSEWAFVTGLNIQRNDYTFDYLVNQQTASNNSKDIQEQMSFDAPCPKSDDTEGKFLKRYVSYYREVQNMGKIKFQFIIYISPCGESNVSYLVTPEELKLIHIAMENGDSFEDVEELSHLYERVMEAARDQLEEDLDICNENDLDPDDLDFRVDFGEEE